MSTETNTTTLEDAVDGKSTDTSTDIKTPAETPVEEQKEETPEEQKVPLSALKSIRGELRDVKEALARATAVPEEIPDITTDPEGYQKYMDAQLATTREDARLDMSEAMARSQYTDDVVDEALQALQNLNSKEVNDRVGRAKSPWDEMVKWHKESADMLLMQSDPEAYKEKMKAEIIAELKGEKPKVGKDKPKPTGKGPSLADITSGKEGDEKPFTPTSLATIFGE